MVELIFTPEAYIQAIAHIRAGVFLLFITSQNTFEKNWREKRACKKLVKHSESFHRNVFLKILGNNRLKESIISHLKNIRVRKYSKKNV